MGLVTSVPCLSYRLLYLEVNRLLHSVFALVRLGRIFIADIKIKAEEPVRDWQKSPNHEYKNCIIDQVT